MRYPEFSITNTENAFKGKNDKDLRFSLWLFRLMSFPFFVNLFSRLTVLAIKIGLPVKKVIKETIFSQFCGGESIEESKKVVGKLKNAHIGSILDYSVEASETEDDFEKTKNEILKIMHLAKDNPAIPYTSLKLTGIVRFEILEKMNYNFPLTIKEEKEFNRLKVRLTEIGDCALALNVPVYLDAEESWIQNAIDFLAEEMMLKYNKKKAIILTTLQMYRWDRINYLYGLIKKARDRNIFIGIKLVRGAYMEKEIARARQNGYLSPIQVNKESTDVDFDKAIDICLENIDIVTLCAGTHNEASTLYLLRRMKELKILNEHPSVYFSQLYGMSDHITYNLADAGYNVTKYLPYGPVKAVIPYLVRRAHENTAISGQMGRELRLIIEEKKRRQNSRLLLAGR